MIQIDAANLEGGRPMFLQALAKHDGSYLAHFQLFQARKFHKAVMEDM